MDLRDRFTCFAINRSLDFAIKDIFGFNSVDYVKNSNSEEEHFKALEKYGPFIILVSGGVKKEGQNRPDYELQDKEKALRDFFYFDLWSYLNKSKGKKIIWRKRPKFRQENGNKGYIYSRLIIN